VTGPVGCRQVGRIVPCATQTTRSAKLLRHICEKYPAAILSTEQLDSLGARHCKHCREAVSKSGKGHHNCKPSRSRAHASTSSQQRLCSQLALVLLVRATRSTSRKVIQVSDSGKAPPHAPRVPADEARSGTNEISWRVLIVELLTSNCEVFSIGQSRKRLHRAVEAQVHSTNLIQSRCFRNCLKAQHQVLTCGTSLTVVKSSMQPQYNLSQLSNQLHKQESVPQTTFGVQHKLYRRVSRQYSLWLLRNWSGKYSKLQQQEAKSTSRPERPSSCSLPCAKQH
jgi:hypothetical protein